MKLKGKTAVITGGGTGIGAATALALAAEGCRVAVAGRRADKLRDVAAQFKGSPAIEQHEVDVSDRASVKKLFTWAADTLRQVDILIHAAGVNIPHRSIADTTPEEWDKLLAINATGAYNCIHAVLPEMRKRRDGTIITISSISGKRATSLGGVGYSSSKFALGALTTSVANEVGRDGVRVSAICPGEVDTPILDNRPSPLTPEHRARILKAEDVAAAVLMVACLPPRARVAEMVIVPTLAEFV